VPQEHQGRHNPRKIGMCRQGTISLRIEICYITTGQDKYPRILFPERCKAWQIVDRNKSRKRSLRLIQDKTEVNLLVNWTEGKTRELVRDVPRSCTHLVKMV